MPSHGHMVCVPCRIVSVVSPSCGHEGVSVGAKWRAPRKRDDTAWRRIAKGDWFWDDQAILRKDRRWVSHIQEYHERIKTKRSST